MNKAEHDKCHRYAKGYLIMMSICLTLTLVFSILSLKPMILLTSVLTFVAVYGFTTNIWRRDCLYVDYISKRGLT